MEKNEISFEYTYSAPEQDEVRQIREKYLPKEENKLEQLRRLDESSTRRGTAASLILGTFGVLTLGIGMCCCMVWGGAWFIPGILVGLIGIIAAASAHPIYARITERDRRKIAPEILRLSQELMGENR